MTGTVTSPSGQEFAWGFEYDSDHAAVEGEDAVAVALLNPDTDEVIDIIGGVTGDFEVDDHGGLNTSPEFEAHMLSVAEDLAAGQ